MPVSAPDTDETTITRYTPDQRVTDQIAAATRTIEPTPDQAERMRRVRAATSEYMTTLAQISPGGRHQSLALTAAEEAGGYAVKAIANEPRR